MVLRETQSGVLKSEEEFERTSHFQRRKQQRESGRAGQCVEGLRPAETATSASGGRAVF